MKVLARSVSLYLAFWFTFAPAFAQDIDLQALREVMATESVLNTKLRVVDQPL